MTEAKEMYGDEIDLAMAWKSGSDLTALAGKPIVLHFEMKDADIYSCRFGEAK